MRLGWSAIESCGVASARAGSPSLTAVRSPRGAVTGLEGTRYFGAIELELALDSLDLAVAIIEYEPISDLVALRRHDGELVARSLVATGWGRGFSGPSVEVLGRVCGTDGIVFFPVGAFDDREAGCVALAKAEIIEQILP
jgi:hypothetical protein